MNAVIFHHVLWSILQHYFDKSILNCLNIQPCLPLAKFTHPICNDCRNEQGDVHILHAGNIINPTWTPSPQSRPSHAPTMILVQVPQGNLHWQGPLHCGQKWAPGSPLLDASGRFEMQDNWIRTGYTGIVPPLGTPGPLEAWKKYKKKL